MLPASGSATVTTCTAIPGKSNASIKTKNQEAGVGIQESA
jgi:hypothetical protein